jgi:PTH1 family peptidyl-tRNA hydrolase
MDILGRLFSLLSPRTQDGEPMWLLIGLGNPGTEYEKNRHNVGFMAVDRIAQDYNFPSFKSKFDGLISEGRIDGQKVALIKPQTYMNESGRCVGPAAKYFKVTPNRVIVFYDELDLLPMRLKVKHGGGSGGNNGIKSIDAHLGRPDYWRVRLGIGHPGDKNRVTGYVLGDFSKEEQKMLPAWLDMIVSNVPLLLNDKTNDFMTRVAEQSKE